MMIGVHVLGPLSQHLLAKRPALILQRFRASGASRASCPSDTRSAERLHESTNAEALAIIACVHQIILRAVEATIDFGALRLLFSFRHGLRQVGGLQ